MKETLNILNKVFVREFYRLNTAFFLLVIVLAFGFLSGNEHRELAQFFTSSLQTMLFPIGIWMLYLLKIISFNHKCLSKQENHIIYDISFLKKDLQYLAACWTLAAQLLPAMLYAFFLIFVALHYGSWQVSILTSIVLLTLLMAGAFLFYRNINNPRVEKNVSVLKISTDRVFRKPLLQFYLEWLIREESALLLGTKLFTTFLLIGTTAFYTLEDLDWRLMSMGVTIAWSSNLMLIFHIRRFEEHFTLLKNLPIPLIKKLMTFSLVFICVMLPETVVMLRNFPGNLTSSQAIGILAYGLSIGIILYASLYLKHSNTEKYNRLVFFFIIMSVVLILFHVPLLVLALINCLAGAFIFFKNYYNYEAAAVDEP